MSTHIRINTQHLACDDARTALSLARKVTKTQSKPMLTAPNASGYYYVSVADNQQLKVFLGILMTASIKFIDRTDSLPHGAIRPKSSADSSTSSTMPLKEVFDEVLDTLSDVLKSD